MRTYGGLTVLGVEHDFQRGFVILKLEGGSRVALTRDMVLDAFHDQPYRVEWQAGLKVQTYNSVARLSGTGKVRSLPVVSAKHRVHARNAVIQKMGFGGSAKQN